MNYRQTTQVPNCVFDQYMPHLKEAELKVLMVIIRQTYGWIDKNTGMRKTRDWISHRQFEVKTGLSRRSISDALQSLVARRLVEISDPAGRSLVSSRQRSGKVQTCYGFIPPVQYQKDSLGLAIQEMYPR